MSKDPLSFLERRIQDLSLDDYEIYQEERSLLVVGAKEGEVEFAESAQELGISVRLFKDGRCGFACASGWAAPVFSVLEKMLVRAAETLSILDQVSPFELPGRTVIASAAKQSRGYREIASSPLAPRNRTNLSQLGKHNIEKKRDLAVDLERQAKAADPRIRRVREASFSEETKTISIRNSGGLDKSHAGTIFELSIMVVAEEKGDQQMAWESRHWSRFERIDAASVGREVAQKAASLLGAGAITTRKAPAVLDPVVGASLLGVLASSFLGDQVRKGRSALKDRLGQDLYSPRVSVIDNGRLSGGYLSRPFDAEGNPTALNTLVLQGKLRQFLHDSSSASEVEASSTGNAVRGSYKEAPHPGPTNFFMEEGDGEGVTGLLEEMGSGLWVRDAIGMHTADPVTGDFSIGATGLWIEGGRTVKPVRGITLSGNLHDLLKRVVRVGKGLRFYQHFGSPPFLIDCIDIGGL